MTAIVRRHLEKEARTARGETLGLDHRSLQIRMEAAAIADDAQTDTVFAEFANLTA
ncbi:hypothetical protein D9M68_926890 [compost metagenome]